MAAGRAGSRVSIKDHKPDTKGATKPMKKSSMFGRIFAHWAQDVDPDDAATAVDAMCRGLVKLPAQQFTVEASWNLLNLHNLSRHLEGLQRSSQAIADQHRIKSLAGFHLN